MRRRTFLTTTGLTLTALAGCTSSEGDTEDVETPTDDETDTQSDSETTETEEEETTEEPSGPSVEITEHELVVDEGEYTTDVYVAATVENTGDAPSGQIKLTAEWYDADGNFLDNDDEYLATLGAGETWSARVFALVSNAEDIDSHELTGEFDTEPPSANPDGLELTGSELQTGEDTAVITGEVANNRDETVSYIEAVGKFYDSDGVVLRSNMANVTDLPAGETWSFQVEALGHVRYDAIADYEVFITDSAL